MSIIACAETRIDSMLVIGKLSNANSVKIMTDILTLSALNFTLSQ